MTEQERIAVGSALYLKAARLETMANQMRNEANLVLGELEPEQTKKYIAALLELKVSMPSRPGRHRTQGDELDEALSEIEREGK